MSWISDEEAEKALHWLVSNAKPLGDAKEQLVAAENMVKRVKAIEMKRHADMPVSAQEREAMASKAIEDAHTNEAKAAGNYEYLRALKDAATARIECWRSLTATQRAMSK